MVRCNHFIAFSQRCPFYWLTWTELDIKSLELVLQEMDLPRKIALVVFSEHSQAIDEKTDSYSAREIAAISVANCS